MYVQTKSSVTVNKKVIRYYYLNVITTLGNHSFRTEEKFLLKFNSTLVYSVQNNNTALQMFIQIMNTSYKCSIYIQDIQPQISVKIITYCAMY